MYPMRPPNSCRASGGPSFSLGFEKNAKIDFFTASYAVGWLASESSAQKQVIYHTVKALASISAPASELVKV